MAIQVGANFSLNNKKFLDDRQSFDTISEMRAFNESNIPDGFLAYNKETDKYYKFNSANDVDNTLGRWREYITEQSIDISSEADNAIIKKTDGLYIKDLSFKFDEFNIAQKTVNDVGSISLLSEPFEFTVSSANTAGAAVSTLIEKDLVLKDDISNYDEIEILVGSTSSKYKRVSKINRYRVKSIAFNDYSNSADNNTDYSTMLCGLFTGTGATNAFGTYCLGFNCWFKNGNTLHVHNFYNPNTSNEFTEFRIEDIIGVKDKSVIIDPVEYVNIESGIEDTPVGHIISMMGNNAPAHYLVCDGTEYNIADYPYLAQYFIDQFGSSNYFGGDGATTFAVPDLRGEFLRGTGVNSHANQGSGSNVGKHQDATEHINLGVNTSASTLWTDTSSPRNGGEQISLAKADSTLKLTTGANTKGFQWKASTWSVATNYSHFTSRPTNTSVLYCIKYEPTYFMKNSYINNTVGFTKTLLFEGSAGETGVTYDLNDSIKNYDLILIKAGFNAESNPHYKTMLIDTDDIDSSKTQNEFLFTRTLLENTTRLIGFNFSQGYDKLTIWTVKASDSTENIAITKIIGIKSATDNNVYTDDEISAAISEVLG